MCPLALELRARPGLETRVCVTGQHRELLDDVTGLFGLHPDIDLDLMRPAQRPETVAAEALTALCRVLDRERPDMVLFHGDTATAFAAALAAFYRGVPAGHVEAGLRSGDVRRPFPEEFHRRAAALTASLHFAPTGAAAENLRREGVEPARIFVTGNTVVDALRYTLRAEYTHPVLDWAGERRLILVTAHRRESHGAVMRGMFRAVRRALAERPGWAAAVPLHPNPAVRHAAAELAWSGNIRCVEPLSPADCHNLEARCALCLTDSGGMQEECAALGVPVLVLRDVTERPEGIAAGAARLAGTAEAEVYRALSALLSDPAALREMARAGNPYGDGCACARIADVLTLGHCEPFEPAAAGG